jgi:hypothetical protein
MSPKKKRPDNAVKDLPPKRNSKNVSSAESSKVKGGNMIALTDAKLISTDLSADLQRPDKHTLLIESDITGKAIGGDSF